MKKIFLLIIILFNIAWLDPFQDRVSEGNSSYNNKKYNDAKKSYKDADNYAPTEKEKNKLYFNKGAADFKNGDYEEAINNYRKSLLSNEKDIQKKAFYNIGNSFLQMKKYKEAMGAYINALKIDPTYTNAKKNIEYILKKKKKDKDKNKKNDKKKNNNDKSKKEKKENPKDKQKVKNMNMEQIKNILKSMKKKPVRREKAGRKRYLEKSW